jgi:hypothetical protein
VLLVAIDPSGEGHEQHLQAGDIGRHGPTVVPHPGPGNGVRAGRVFGHYGLIDHAWLRKKPKWEVYVGLPISFAMVWRRPIEA